MPDATLAIEPASPRPLYLQLADDLRRQIDNGTLKAGDQLMPEVELAQRQRMARGTVRQALQLLTNQGLLIRTRRKGTFVAGNGTLPATALIDIVVPFLRDELTTTIIHGVESTLRLNAYSLIFGHSDGSLEVEVELVARLERERARGLILMPTALPGEAARLAEVLPERLPIVLIDRTIPGFTAPSVLVDNRGGAYRAVAHLIAQGHRRIGCVTHAGQVSSVEDRLQGYEQALLDARLAPLPPAVLEWREPGPAGQPADYYHQDMTPVDRLVQAPEPATALFCINDFIALGVMRHVLGRGLRIPEQVAMVGFDDIPLAPFMPVPLTTVAQPKFEIGVQAALLLLDRISGKTEATPAVTLPTALVVRASSAAP
jgi:DNA-binding LacI/PurR family transcriptional regulator